MKDKGYNQVDTIAWLVGRAKGYTWRRVRLATHLESSGRVLCLGLFHEIKNTQAEALVCLERVSDLGGRR